MARSEPADSDDDLAHAVGLYALGEVNEGKAAEIAGVTRWEMRDILEDAGLELRHGPRTVAGARDDAGLALDENGNGE
ncbi:UPF0175 family protein [Halococcus agarilyticus]|uniref:UPF0175 family protein n=1 Tax=Halococcus agarilyticus TaxID=1232219 RepID=UPI000677E034|nr:UPF0175 family protein [Halococcus agarilyticus]